MRSARFHQKCRVEGHGRPSARVRKYGRLSRKPESTKNSVTPKSSRASAAPVQPWLIWPVSKAAWVSTTMSAPMARTALRVGKAAVRGSSRAELRSGNRSADRHVVGAQGDILRQAGDPDAVETRAAVEIERVDAGLHHSGAGRVADA